ncbi:MAG: terminase family protein [Kiritimatiellales bacterium]
MISQEVNLNNYFMFYQVQYLMDKSRFKMWEKTRRGGMTYVQSYEDVEDASRANGAMDVYFSSADLTAAQEYIQYCAFWATMLKVASEYLGEVVLDKEKDVKAYCIKFATGKRIFALSSNPKQFRSKGGKLVLDEYAFHDDQEAMWKAARPIVTWGYPVRIISTYNGKGTRYARMVADAKKGKALRDGRWYPIPGQKSNPWSLHTTTILDAVRWGLADKIAGRLLTSDERQKWLDEERESVGDEDTWMQEYMCEPVDGLDSWLTYELISGVEHPDAGRPERYSGGPCYFGNDIGLRRDLWCMWVWELVGDVLWTREVSVLRKKKFAEHDAEMNRLFNYYKMIRGGMDQTGMGEKPVEDAKKRHGEHRVEGFVFTAPLKVDLARIGKERFEDKTVRVPVDTEVREDFHMLKCVRGTSGFPRFIADHNSLGHADRTWASFMGIDCALTEKVEYNYERVGSEYEPFLM